MSLDAPRRQGFLVILTKVLLMIVALVGGFAGLLLTLCGGMLFGNRIGGSGTLMLALAGIALVVGAVQLFRWILRGV
jgi:hypothetical protein